MTNETAMVSADLIKEMITEEGYEVIDSGEGNIFHVRDVDAGLRITCALEDNILFNTLPCFSTAKANVNEAMMSSMLDAENGISTSSFQLYDMPDGQVRVALSNFCKLQDLGPDDHDDILSCIDFLLVDVVAAHSLLAEYV
ncbi:MAG: hypothetical protein AAF488_00110 [Planctomycetota bacterium]